MLAKTFLNQYQIKQSRIRVFEKIHLWKCVAITEPIGAAITTTGTHTVKKCQAYMQVIKYMQKGFIEMHLDCLNRIDRPRILLKVVDFDQKTL